MALQLNFGGIMVLSTLRPTPFGREDVLQFAKLIYQETSPMRANSLLFSALAGLFSLGLASSTFAQGTHWTVYGDAAYSIEGFVLSNMGDINGDGAAEVLTGAPWDNGNANDGGYARVRDGATGVVIQTHFGDSALDEMGYVVSGAGDVDGDGVNDYMAAAPYDDNDPLGTGTTTAGSGTVRVWSGSSHQLLYELIGDASKDFLGWSLADLGDVDGDGNDDFLVGSEPSANGGSTGGAGYVKVHSGATGAVIHYVVGLAANDFFGCSASYVGDVNGDGFNDFVVGARGTDVNANKTGSVTCHSGADASIIWTANGDAQGDQFGSFMDYAGDVNGDGTGDVIASATLHDTNGVNSGMARVLSGVDGSTIHTFYGTAQSDYFGGAVGGGDDIDGDGFADVLVGMGNSSQSGANRGLVWAFSGATGAVLWTLAGDNDHDLLGDSVDVVGDVNGDGIADCAAGGIQYDPLGPGNGVVKCLDPTGTPPPPPPLWGNLPTTFVAIGSGYADDFEAHAGVVPPQYAVNEMEFVSRAPSAEAWCNMGQKGPYTGPPNSGSHMLELGGDPAWGGGYITVAGLAMGLDGTGLGGLQLEMMVYNYGEETNADDGVFLSNDGVNWEAATAPGIWTGQPIEVWTPITVDLSTTSINTDGQFYMIIAQSDNYGIGTGLDGICFDDILVKEIPPAGPQLSVNNLVSGQQCTIEVNYATPGHAVIIAYSLRGGGPTNTPYGTVLLTAPFEKLPPVPANSAGNVTIPINVPNGITGLPVWLHAGELIPPGVSGVVFTNGLAEVVG